MDAIDTKHLKQKLAIPLETITLAILFETKTLNSAQVI